MRFFTAVDNLIF